MTAAIDITGHRFGKLVAIRPAERNTHGQVQWLLRCDCGGQTTAPTGQLRYGKRKSCACGRSKPTHDMRKTRLYSVWCSMKARCFRPKHVRFHRYGGRGIGVSINWLDSFQCFADWALANGYADDLQIDRIDNDGHYIASNCRFVTPAVNAANRGCSNANANKPSCDPAPVVGVRVYAGYRGKPECVQPGSAR